MWPTSATRRRTDTQCESGLVARVPESDSAPHERELRSGSRGFARRREFYMRRVLTLALALSLAAPISSAFAAGAGAAAGAASISGSARVASKVKTTIRLRNVANNQVVATTTADTAGRFSFAGLEPGNYVVEVLNASGAVVSASTPLALEAGAAMSDVAVGGGAAVASAAASTPFFASLPGIATIGAAAAVAGVTVAVTRPQASSSQ